jgi:hypothetical protein
MNGYKMCVLGFIDSEYFIIFIFCEQCKNPFYMSNQKHILNSWDIVLLFQEDLLH